MEADQVGRPAECRDGPDVVLGQPRLGRLQAAVGRVQRRRQVQDAAQVGAQPVVVGQRQGRAERGDRSPSVSSQAASTPSSEVPLISPIVRIFPVRIFPVCIFPVCIFPWPSLC